jgi:hypothetical protein
VREREEREGEGERKREREIERYREIILTSSSAAMTSRMKVAMVEMKPRKMLPQLSPTMAELGTLKRYAPTYISGVIAHL